MKIGKRDTRKQTEAGEPEESGSAKDKQPQCSKCGKRLPSTGTKGICKHCEAKVEGRRAAILGAAVTAGSMVIKKYGPKVVPAVMRMIKK